MNDATQFFNAGGGYEIERSLRFNSADSAYLNRTPASAGNRKTWTWAGWVKRSALGARQALFTVFTSPYLGLEFSDTDTIIVHDSTAPTTLISRQTAAVYRDTSAWYHVVLAYDTTQATAANRVKLYVNGVEVTVFQTNVNPAQNTDTAVNMAYLHAIGVWHTLGYYQNGYLADIHFIDGQALDPSSFGEFDTNGVWQPIDYAGTFGTNGFYLPFSDNSTAAALGTDTSGNSNTWTVNNISVTAGAGNDSLVDSPTNYGTDTGAGGEVRGNYATFGALSGTGTLSNGNLDATGTIYQTSSIGVTSGKWYCEITAGSVVINSYVGIYGDPNAINTYALWGTGGYFTAGVGSPSNNFSSSTITAGDVIGVAFDYDNGTFAIYRNGSSIGQYSSLTLGAGPWFIGMHTNVAAAVPWAINFGQRPFAYTAPSGFKALCTTNLPSTTITTSGSYTGNGVADGPFVYLNGVPTAMTVGGNAVTFGTHADKLSNGFKVRTNNTTYNQNAVVYNYSITSTGDPFKTARAQSN
jgi:hypothetical protein